MRGTFRAGFPRPLRVAPAPQAPSSLPDRGTVSPLGSHGVGVGRRVSAQGRGPLPSVPGRLHALALVLVPFSSGGSRVKSGQDVPGEGLGPRARPLEATLSLGGHPARATTVSMFIRS